MGENLTMTQDKKKSTKRQYPPIYEKVVPIALALIAMAIVVILGIILAVVLGIFPVS
jgi:hypothetical protein